MSPLKISMAGSSAVLLDGPPGRFDDAVQRRVWAVARAAKDLPAVQETVPGMNNLLITFDPLSVDFDAFEQALRALWSDIAPEPIDGRDVEIPVVYGGDGGADLADVATHAGMTVDAVVQLHASATYLVATIGSMPGYPYLSGLDPALALGRRATPRAVVPEGSVIIGGGQAGIMPITAPSGWHMLGHTDIRLFDAAGDPPCLLRAGDRVHFTIADILA